LDGKIVNLETLISSLRYAFAKEEVKNAVVDAYWLAINRESGIDSTGFCLPASEVIYRLCGGKDKWQGMSISRKDWKHGGHVYLQDRTTGEILDITADQYTGKGLAIPYHLGKDRSFQDISSDQAKKLAKAIGIDL
jgi:hypothetical protein